MYDTFEEGTAPTVGARRALCAPTQLVLPFIFIYLYHSYSFMIFMEPGMDFQSKTAYLEDVQG
jgi:hypothetical protein